jgi:hypothetical protein
MCLKDFGWETYRLRSHSIPTSVTNIDTHLSADRRASKGGITNTSAYKNIALQVTPATSAVSSSLSPSPSPSSSSSSSVSISTGFKSKNETGGTPTVDCSSLFQCQGQRDSSSADVKSKRSLTMPSSILLNVNEKNDVRNGRKSNTRRHIVEHVQSCRSPFTVIIPEETMAATPTNTTATVSFSDCLEPGTSSTLANVPLRRCSSISKELTNTTTQRDSGIVSGATSLYSDVDYSRSPSFGAHSLHNQCQSAAAAQSATDSLPLERFRPRSKSAHQSNALRRSKQLQKVPEVIQALRAPAAAHGGASEPSATDELYRSRLLRCNFLLKPDAVGYEYARRVQKLSHATYSHLISSNANEYLADENYVVGHADELTSPFRGCKSKLSKKIYAAYDSSDQRVETFLTDDG